MSQWSRAGGWKQQPMWFFLLKTVRNFCLVLTGCEAAWSRACSRPCSSCVLPPPPPHTPDAVFPVPRTGQERPQERQEGQRAVHRGPHEPPGARVSVASAPVGCAWVRAGQAPGCHLRGHHAVPTRLPPGRPGFGRGQLLVLAHAPGWEHARRASRPLPVGSGDSVPPRLRGSCSWSPTLRPSSAAASWWPVVWSAWGRPVLPGGPVHLSGGAVL